MALHNEKERQTGPLWRFRSRNLFYRADSQSGYCAATGQSDKRKSSTRAAAGVICGRVPGWGVVITQLAPLPADKKNARWGHDHSLQKYQDVDGSQGDLQRGEGDSQLHKTHERQSQAVFMHNGHGNQRRRRADRR